MSYRYRRAVLPSGIATKYLFPQNILRSRGFTKGYIKSKPKVLQIDNMRRRKFRGYGRMKRRGGRARWNKRNINKAKLKAIELKTHDLVAINTEVNNSGTFVYLSGIAEGDSSAEREAIKITPRRFTFRYTMQAKGTATDNVKWRVIILQDKQNNGVAPTYQGTAETSVMKSTTSQVGIQSLFARFTRGRYKILYDECGSCTPQSDGEELGNYEMRKVNFNFKPIHSINYTKGTSAIDAASKGALYLLFYSDRVSGDTAGLINYSWRLRFYG